MRAHVEAYGCALSYGEAREIEDLLAGLGWHLVDSPDASDLNVLVTCVVVQKTERAMLKRVEALASGPKLIVTGCLATAGRERAEPLAPDAAFVPPGDIDAISSIAGRAGPAGGPVPQRPYEIVPLASGCAGDCSYCITKLARGSIRSRTADRIVSQVERAVASGPKEVQLTAQDTAAYGSDTGDDLPSLVERVCAIPRDFRLRVGMMNPASALRIRDRLAEMYRRPKVFKFLHLPVQSASDRVLREMGRKYSIEEFEGLVDTVRSAAPDATLSTDLIVGYPGETDEDHASNLEFVERVRPDIVNVTRFSPRPGTRAAAAPDAVPGAVAKERSRELGRVRFRVSLGINRGWVGRKVTALATEHVKPGTTVVRTDDYRQIVVPEPLEIGTYHEVEVVQARTTYLVGRRCRG
jgi:MiaB-like tRNA modifying enzyme